MSWHEFISGLSPCGQEFAEPIWKMSDGAAFRQPIPALAGSTDDQDLAEFARGYKLHEIIAVEFDFSDAEVQSSANTTGARQEQFDAIEHLARVSGLTYRRKPDRIIVRGAYTC